MSMSVSSMVRAAVATAAAVASIVVFAGSAAAAAVTALTITPIETVSFTGNVATYDGTCSPTPCAATIDWGDATNTAGTVSGSTGAWDISGSHTYAEDGTYTTTITVTDNGTTLTGSATANVAESGFLIAMVGPQTSTEGTAFSGTVATFTDPGSTDAASAYLATIAWGDGTTSTATISGSSAPFIVSGAHTYIDEGAFTITVTVSESNSPSVLGSTTDAMMVADADVLSLIVLPITPVEGTAVTGPLADLNDTYSGNTASDLVGTIDWGDGTSTAATISGAGGIFLVSGSHIYADEGSFTIVIQVADDAPGTATAASTHTVTVTEGDTFAVTIGSPGPVEGTSFGGAIATFTDTNSAATAADIVATVNWGDGSTTAGTVAGGPGNFSVSGPHTYAEQGTYTVVVTVADDAPGTAAGTATGTVTVADAPLSGSASPPTAVVGVALTNVVVGTFTDPSKELPSAYTATINWGDGTTTAGTITDPPGTVKVSGSHTYSAAGSHTLTVTLVDIGGTSATVSGTVAVSAGLPAASGPPKPLPLLPLALLCISAALLATALVLRRRAPTTR